MYFNEKMMKKILICLLIPFLAACRADFQFQEAESSNASYLTLYLSADCPGTVSKAGTDWAAADETALDTLLYYVFDESRSGWPLEALAVTVFSSGQRTPVEVLPGRKRVVALANPPLGFSPDDICCYADLASSRISLAGQLHGGDRVRLCMKGEANLTVTAAGAQQTLYLQRLVGKVQLGGILNRTTLAYTDTLHLERVYLLNAALDAPFLPDGSPVLPSAWANAGAAQEDLPDAVCHFLFDARGRDLPRGERVAAGSVLIAMPNPVEEDAFGLPWTPRWSRLVVEVSCQGQTYCYPVPLSSMERNSQYSLGTLVLKHLGADSPDGPLPQAAVELLDVDILPWDEAEEDEITI